MKNKKRKEDKIAHSHYNSEYDTNMWKLIRNIGPQIYNNIFLINKYIYVYIKMWLPLKVHLIKCLFCTWGNI